MSNELFLQLAWLLFSVSVPLVLDWLFPAESHVMNLDQAVVHLTMLVLVEQARELFNSPVTPENNCMLHEKYGQIYDLIGTLTRKEKMYWLAQLDSIQLRNNNVA
jgi:hypothetical protein